MKGENEMTFKFNYAELLGRELQRDRMQEAERERLIKRVSGWNPSLAEIILINLEDRWSRFWSRVTGRKSYIPISQVPKKSSSI